MKRLAMALVVAVMASGCCHKVYPPTQVDSVRIEYRDRVVKVIDTAYIEIPKIVERNVTRDTSSHLVNDYAESYASVSDGLLFHSLETVPQVIYKPIERLIEVHDTIIRQAETRLVYEDRIVEKVKYPKSYWWLLGIVAGLIVCLGLRIYLKFK